jgi:ABC-type ATPase involved in cell division
MLDGAQAAQVVALLRTARARGTTCLVTTQGTGLARVLEGRILQLVAGRLRPEGDPV